ncbi:MAG: VTT domain-containing protein [Micromonosporaceae bacterium]|nr:VTT domain-containing protein [Micromonosporaceae bacterium]
MILLTASLGCVMVLDGIPLLGLLVPADAAVMVAMAARGPVDGVPVMASVVCGYLLTASLGHFIGRRYGTLVRHSRFGTWIGEARWTTGERLLTRGGRKMLVAAPFLPFVSTMVPVVAGVLRVPYRRFVLSVAVGSVAWTGLYVTLGAFANIVSTFLPGGAFTTAASIGVGLALTTLCGSSVRRLVKAPGEPSPVPAS